eukprot:9039652-Alexandrium_andersonii.AAC.1
MFGNVRISFSTDVHVRVMYSYFRVAVSVMQAQAQRLLSWMQAAAPRCMVVSITFDDTQVGGPQMHSN